MHNSKWTREILAFISKILENRQDELSIAVKTLGCNWITVFNSGCCTTGRRLTGWIYCKTYSCKNTTP